MAEERGARLQRMNQQMRLAAETVEEREARLQRMNQQTRLAAETAEESQRPGYSI